MATSTGTSSAATTTAISTAVLSTAGTATPTVTFASIMSAIDTSVSRQVERALGDHSRTASSPSHSAATTSSVITTPSSSAALAGMSFPCIFSCCALFSSPYYVQFLVYHSYPSHFHVQKRRQFFFCSWPLFSAPFSEVPRSAHAYRQR